MKHNLVESRVGANRHLPGYYKCECGEIYTDINRYWKHARAERKKLREQRKQIKKG